MRYDRFIKSFCECDKCEYFSYKQQYRYGLQYRDLIADGKIYYCSHPTKTEHGKVERVPLISPECPKYN